MSDFIPYEYYSKAKPVPPCYKKEPKRVPKGRLQPEALPLFADYSELVDGVLVVFHSCPLQLDRDEDGNWTVVFRADQCSVVTWG